MHTSACVLLLDRSVLPVFEPLPDCSLDDKVSIALSSVN